jgi:gliding motility-associated-like protein
MKNKYHIYSILILCFFAIAIPNTLNAQLVCDSVFMKEYAAAGNIEPLTIKYLAGNESLVAGRGNTGAGTPYKAMVAKLSASGQVNWSMLIGGGTADVFTGIVVLSNGTYLLYGTTASFGYSAGKIFLVNVNASGAVLWSRQLGTAAADKNSIKKIRQYSDGDLIGTFNVNDSSTQSDPVLFKIGLDGTVRWLKRFDNNGEESFTGLDFEGNTIYAGGFFTGTKKRGVLTKVNASDGAAVNSENLFYDSIVDEEVVNLEIENNNIAYGLWMKKVAGSYLLNKTILIQTNAAGNKTFETILENTADSFYHETKKTGDDGFLVLKNYYVPQVIKLNRFNSIDWSARQSPDNFYKGQINQGLDVTTAGGSISGGYYQNFLTGGLNRMVVTKTNPSGESGSCIVYGFTFFTNTITLMQQAFNWQSVQPASFIVNEPLTPSVTPGFIASTYNLCDQSSCTDTTALPPPCIKTYLVEYASPQLTKIRDAVYTSDGGRVAVGNMQNNGWIVKFKKNGDIAWSKKVDDFGHNLSFMRVMKTTDNNILAFANNYYAINNGVSKTVKAVKLDNNGNILFSKEIIKEYYSEMADVTSTPDGGFVIILNGCYGCGYTYTHVIRFDANMQVIWKKELKHAILTPVYKSVICTNDAVYMGHDNYTDFNKDKGGVTKLSLVTGDSLWNRQFVINNYKLLFNKLAVVNDTVYAFINVFDPGFFGTYSRLQMIRLSAAGAIINSRIMGDYDIVLGDYYDYLDYATPMVTLTPQNNFIFGAQVQTASGKALNITRFTTNGDALWSKNYTQLQAHHSFNIHANANGAFMIGTVSKPHPLNAKFTNSFMMKVDSVGNILPGNTSGTCSNTAVPFSAVNVVASPTTSYYIDDVIDLTGLLVQPSPVLEQPAVIDAELYCSQQSVCGPVVLAVSGTGCSINDTLTYYLGNNNCGAVAAWSYDTSFFYLLHQSADTLKLKPKKTGTTLVTAAIEDGCSLTTQSLPAAILVAASNLNLGNDTIICPGSNIVLRAGPGYSSYLWNNSTTDSLLTVNTPGLYYVRVQDNCGGAATDSILISSVNNAMHITGNPVKCNADTVLLTATLGYQNYQWLPAGNGVFSSNTAKVYPLQTTRYYVQVQVIAGCLAKDSFLITVNTSPPVYLGKDTAICYNKTVALTAPAGFAGYLWNTGSILQGITVSAAGMYYVAATFGNGCVSRDSIDVKKFPFAYPSLGNDTAVCAGSNFKLSPSTYSSYLWNTGAVSSSIVPTAANPYWVVVTDNNGCKGADTITITAVNPVPADFLQGQAFMCWRETIPLNPVKTFVTYLWSNGSTSPGIFVNTMGAYVLAVTDANGCKGKDTIQVVKRPGCADSVYIMNAFTPNGDGKNEVFRPVISGITEAYSLEIFNRYGQLVFSTANADIGWDGSFKGAVQPQGNYVYTCKYKFPGYPVVSRTGSLLLIR